MKSNQKPTKKQGLIAMGVLLICGSILFVPALIFIFYFSAILAAGFAILYAGLILGCFVGAAKVQE